MSSFFNFFWETISCFDAPFAYRAFMPIKTNRNFISTPAATAQNRGWLLKHGSAYSHSRLRIASILAHAHDQILGLQRKSSIFTFLVLKKTNFLNWPCPISIGSNIDPHPSRIRFIFHQSQLFALFQEKKCQIHANPSTWLCDKRQNTAPDKASVSSTDDSAVNWTAFANISSTASLVSIVFLIQTRLRPKKNYDERKSVESQNILGRCSLCF